MFKKIKKVSILMSAALLLAACGSNEAKPAENNASNAPTETEKASNEKAQASDGEKIKVEVVAKGFQHQFWKAVNTGAENAAKDLNAEITFQGPENETAVQEQVQMFANAVNKKPAAIAYAALDTKASIDLLKQAKDDKIPVVGFDSGVPNAPEGTIQATAATDNIAASAMAADKLYPEIEAKLKKASVDKKVRVGVVSQEVNSASISDRTKGFIDKMVEQASKLDNLKDKIAVVGNDKFANDVKEKDAALVIDLAVPANVTDAEGQTQAQTLLNKEDLIAIYGSNEFAAKSIINADNAVGGKLGKDKIIGVGFDSGAIQIDAIKKGVLFGSITQDPISIGYKAVELAVKASKGEKVEDIDTGAVWYNAENIDSKEVKSLLYE